MVKTNISCTGEGCPGAVAVDPFRRLVFYSSASPFHIAVMGTDGDNSHVVLYTFSFPMAFTLDMVNE